MALITYTPDEPEHIFVLDDEQLAMGETAEVTDERAQELLARFPGDFYLGPSEDAFSDPDPQDEITENQPQDETGQEWGLSDDT
jgi:hypothetical protein